MSVVLTYVERLRAVWSCTGEMVEAASAQEWDRFEALVAQRQQLIDQAGEVPAGLPLSEARLAEQVVQRIMEEDQRVSELLRTAMTSLQGELQQASQARSSASAYFKATILPQPQKARFVDKQR